MSLVTRFRIDVDTQLSRRQRRRLQLAAFRWRMQMDSKQTEAPWRQDWGVQYECDAASEAEARARVAAALGEDLGERLIVRPTPSGS
jgi:glycine/D-amino acid oxidase-like deaminating enzyme